MYKKDSRPAGICCLFCEERGKKGGKSAESVNNP